MNLVKVEFATPQGTADIVDADRNGGVVARVFEPDVMPLFLAASDLLAACVLARKWLANSVPTCDVGGPEPLPIIEAAIAKAEGRDE